MTVVSPPVAPQKLLRGYSAPPGSYDQALTAEGTLRPHWDMFVKLLDEFGWEELGRRWEQSRQVIHENGVTYNVYGDPNGNDRPWNLDAAPLLMPAEEWRTLEKGLVQRATLLNLLLGDLYGAQRMLREGLLPASMVFGNPAFLRACHGATLPEMCWLHFCAVDLGMSADGKMWAIGDRTQAPSGAGYALENRIVLSRALPDVFRDCRVQRLAPFFRTVQKTLAGLAPRHRDNPRIVLLTPGPYNETYFEHAYLARYLGYTLVEGADLTVRDHRVYLKTLGGLQDVDVILRRLDDDWCDPLELRGDSALGVAGLVESVLRGNVAVANALGSGLTENPALPAFLERLCKRLLGQDLLLPSAPTWWCGEAVGLDHVIANLDQMVIKRTVPRKGRESIFGDELSKEQKEELIGRIKACPGDYVGQQSLPLSTAPVLVDDHFEPRRVVLRAHLVASGDGYAVMPGGLSRFGPQRDSLVVSMQKGGGSKDVWVLADGPVDTFSLLSPAGKPVALSRGGGDLPSRVAENLFWLGRYLERAEGLCRLVRGIVVRQMGQAESSGPELALLLGTLMGSAPLNKDGKVTLPESELLATVFDSNRRGSLKSTLIDAHRLARILRDRISLDTWRIVNNLDQDFIQPAQDEHVNQLSGVLALMDRMVIVLSAFGGLAMESMTRGHAWRFLDMGRRIERGLHTLRLLEGTLVPVLPRDTALLEAVLEIADSVMTYRRRYLTSLQAHAVLDLLLCDESNPRGVAFHVKALSDDVDQLPRNESSARPSPEQQILLRCMTGIRLTDITAETAAVEKERRVKVEELLGVVSDHLTMLSDTLGQSYFSHATVSRQSMVQAPNGSGGAAAAAIVRTQI